MGKTTVSGMLLTLLLSIGVFTLPLNVRPIRATTVTVPDDYPTIQSAINAAGPGDTIYVRDGTYHEHVVVNKTVSLVGQSRKQTVIDGDWTGIVVRVTANNVLISNFTVQHSGWGLFDLPNCGIRLDASYCSVTNNILSNNDCSGIRIYGFSSNRISGNNITANDWHGIMLYSSSHNIICANNITGNDGHGIWVHSSSANNTVTENAITANRDDGIYLWNSHHINVFGNNITANGWSGLNFDLSFNDTIHSNNITVNGRDGIYLSRTSNSTIYENRIAFNQQHGVELQFSSMNNTISRNTITENQFDGILDAYSWYNRISENTISDNRYGVAYADSSNNALYRNNFVNNTQHVNDASWSSPSIPPSSNVWDNGCEGNYWDDYSGIDSDDDGIGDTPYVIDANNQDNYPLVSPFLVGDINHDGAVDLNDLLLVDGAYGTEPGDADWNCHCDIAGSEEDSDGVIDVHDLTTVGKNYGKNYPE
jgi:parallel beta-helix repeat protein